MTLITTTTPTAPTGVPITQRAMLVDLTIAVWSGRKYDRSVSADVARQHNTNTDVGRYNKRLLARNAPLTELTKIANAARTDHYAMTSPWLDSGQRILSNDMYLNHYLPRMKTSEDAYFEALDKFVQAYPQLINEAMRELNGLFDPSDYPHPSDIRRRFRFGFNIMPLPDKNDFRVDLGADEIARVQAQIEANIDAALAEATRDLYGRISNVVGHMAERLRAYTVTTDGTTGIFRDSLVQNVRELAGLLPALNITGDADLSAITERIRRELTRFDADVLRDSQTKRDETAAAAESIMAEVESRLAGIGEFLA